MHDPTEGGVRAALHELAHASGVRLRIELDRVAIRPETDRLCRHFGIDPLGLIGSGALLVAIASSRVAPLLRAWQRDGIAGHVIGRAERGRGVLARRGGRPGPVPLGGAGRDRQGARPTDAADACSRRRAAERSRRVCQGDHDMQALQARLDGETRLICGVARTCERLSRAPFPRFSLAPRLHTHRQVQSTRSTD